jgi:hypothetical protein
MKRGCAAAAAIGFLAFALLVGCGSSKSAAPDSASVKEGFLRGVAQIRGSPDKKKLHRQLLRTLARVRSGRGSTELGRRGRRLAIQGFAWTLKGTESQLDLIANDSGNIEAAVRDAKKADRYLGRGANLLRAAGRVFGIRIGKLNGY